MGNVGRRMEHIRMYLCVYQPIIRDVTSGDVTTASRQSGVRSTKIPLTLSGYLRGTDGS